MAKICQPRTSQPTSQVSHDSHKSNAAPKGRNGTASYPSAPSSSPLAQMAALLNNSPVVQAQLEMAKLMNPEATPPDQLTAPVQLESSPGPAANRTGLPDNLKTGVEDLSGISLDDVRVHYNSAKPAQLNALAYAQGTDIHVAPGQEGHLPHEAWHVVQQKQGRVRPTMQMKQGVAVNDDAGLEHEADIMGAKAAAFSGGLNSTCLSQGKTMQAVAQLRTYTSKSDEGFRVETWSNNAGSYAQAHKEGEEFEPSSIEYTMMKYRPAKAEDLVPTKVPMATQTDTMHAHPQRAGVGLLLLATLAEHLEEHAVRYFQPDILATAGGNAMKDFIQGQWVTQEFMAKLIKETDQVEGDTSTYPAIEVDIGATKATLESKITEKFNLK